MYNISSVYDFKNEFDKKSEDDQLFALISTLPFIGHEFGYAPGVDEKGKNNVDGNIQKVINENIRI